MRKHHPANERIKHKYFGYCRHANRMQPSSIESIAAAIAHFEVTNGHKDFKQFRVSWATKHKQVLEDCRNQLTGNSLSRATIYARLMALKAFFKWLAGQQGYKSRITYSDAAYFNPSNRDTEIAKTTREKRIATIDEIRQALFGMPDTTDVHKRNRAVVALVAMTAARDGAVASFKIKDVDLARRRLYQDARHANTKFSKSFHTDFCPVGDDIECVFADYMAHMTGALRYGPEAPLFPATKVGLGASGHLEVLGLSDKGWKSAAPIRAIFKGAFEAVGLPYFNPHSFRDSLMQLAYDLNLTHQEMKAWSQNLGHENVMTSLRNYGTVTTTRQSELIAGLRAKASGDATEGPSTEWLLEELKRRMG